MLPFSVTPPLLLTKPFCCYIGHGCFTFSLPGALINREEISYYRFGRIGCTRGVVLACLWTDWALTLTLTLWTPGNFIRYSREKVTFCYIRKNTRLPCVPLFLAQRSEESLASFPRELEDQNLMKTAQFRENWSAYLFVVPTNCWLASVSYLVTTYC